MAGGECQVTEALSMLLTACLHHCLNHSPSATPHPHCPWKNCLPQNLRLAPECLRTAALLRTKLPLPPACLSVSLDWRAQAFS